MIDVPKRHSTLCFLSQMNADSMDHNHISVENLSGEQSSRTNNKQMTNPTPNLIRSGRVVKTNAKKKRHPNTPTPLYIFFLSH